MIKARTLPQSLPAVNFMALSPAQIGEVLILQEAIFNDLRQNKKEYHLVLLDSNRRQTMMDEGHLTVGGYIGNVLVSQCIFCRLDKANLVADRYQDNEGRIFPIAKEDFYIINEMVHPFYRGHNILNSMLTWARAEIYFETGSFKPKLWATVIGDNDAGYHANVKCGFSVVGRGVYRADDSPLLLMRAPLIQLDTVGSFEKSA